MKIALIGGHNTAKTSLRLRFCHDIFEETVEPTVGIDFDSETIAIDGTIFKTHIYGV